MFNQLILYAILYVRMYFINVNDSTLAFILRDEQHNDIKDSVIVTVGGRYLGEFNMKDTIYLNCDTFVKPFEISFIPLKTEFGSAFQRIVDCNH